MLTYSTSADPACLLRAQVSFHWLWGCLGADAKTRPRIVADLLPNFDQQSPQISSRCTSYLWVRASRRLTSAAAMSQSGADASQGEVDSSIQSADPKAERKLVRKIDMILMPLLTISFGLQYYDSTRARDGPGLAGRSPPDPCRSGTGIGLHLRHHCGSG